MPDDPERAYVAFSGGGAKGVVHVGALKAIEQADFHVRGWAGTSIGALIATLAAAGFTADEIIDAEKKTSIMKRLAEIDPALTSVTALFGHPVRWQAIRLFRLLTRHLWFLWAFLAATLLFPGIAWLLPVTAWRVGWLIAGFLLLGLIIYVFNGMGSSKPLKKALNTLLQQKIFPDDEDAVVCFRDFGRNGRPSLKIVAANLTRSQLELFSPDDTPDVDVANAVGASISLPMIFHLPRIVMPETRRSRKNRLRGLMAANRTLPTGQLNQANRLKRPLRLKEQPRRELTSRLLRRMRSRPLLGALLRALWRDRGRRELLRGKRRPDGDLFTDGGIVSNLPAWCFDEERAIDPDAHTIIVDIPEAPRGRGPGRLTWLGALIQTGFFGGVELNLRGFGGALNIPLPTSIEVLEFDIRMDRVATAVVEAQTYSESLIRQHREHRDRVKATCDWFREEASARLSMVLGGETGLIRAAVAIPDDGYTRSLRLVHCSGFDDMADHSVLLPIEGSVAGLAWRSRDHQFESSPDKLKLSGAENIRLRRLIHPGLKWVYGVPISTTQSSEPDIVVLLDGDKAFEGDPMVFFDELREVAVNAFAAPV